MTASATSTTETDTQPPGWQQGLWSAAGILAAVYSVVFIIWTFTQWGGEETRAFIADVGYLPLSLFAAVACMRIWRDSAVDAATRRAWGFIGLGLFANFAGDALWFNYEIIQKAQTFPSLADAGYLAFYPLVMIGLLNFPHSPISRSEQIRLYLDVAIVVVASWMGIWYFILSPGVSGGLTPSLESAILVAYPLIDLAIIYGIVVFIFRRPQISLRSGLGHLLLAMLLFVLGDVIFGVQSLNEAYVSGSPIDSSWLLSYLLFIFAGLEQYANLKKHGGRFNVARRLKYLWLLPYAMLALGYSLVIGAFAASTEVTDSLRWLSAGALALTFLTSLRQIFDLRENRRLNDELLLRLKELEETDSALSRAQHLAGIGTLAAGVAHEINNPISVVVACADVLKRRAAADQWNKDTFLTNLGRIERSAWHASKIARSLLTYAHGGDLQLTRTTARALIDDALGLMQIIPDNVELRVAIDENTPNIICDHDKIAQVLVNLIDNACYAIYDPVPRAGSNIVTIAAGPNHNGGMMLRVSDTGSGMNAEVLARAFDPFYTTKPMGKGTGLGLSICRGIVRAHDGELCIDSTEGKGTSAFVALPPEPRARRNGSN